VHAQASIGLAVTPAHGRTRGEILFAADAAMYAAKSSGDRVRFHAPERDEKSAQLGLAEELYAALERHELVVEYQPICTVAGEPVAAEALVRWEHPERGRLLPEEFLDAAERYRLTGAVAQRVLDVALMDLARWRAYGVPMTVSVNLAAADLRDETVVATIAEALLEHRLPAEALTVDVNERSLTPEDLPRMSEVLRALHDLGVRLALDDYGSGGVGVGTLADLPFDEVKLDRRFVRDVAISERDTGVVRASLDLVHSLGMRMVAEGVEDKRARTRLGELGCDLVQGWHVGRPGTSTDIEVLLSRPTGGKHRMAPDRAGRVPDQPGHGDEHPGAVRALGRRPRGITTSGQ
jgi:EAL domain-containing protein (putative c-di-GMP-specific phosphodiesterase class I)